MSTVVPPSRQRVRDAVGSSVLGVVAGFAAWYLGLDWPFAVGVALTIVAIWLVWRSASNTTVVGWTDEPPVIAPGSRDDVVRLAWSLRMRKRSIHDAAYKRLRNLAAARLARHGLDLFDPADRASIEARTSPQVYGALVAASGRLPSLSAASAVLDALDRLDAGDPLERNPRERGRRALPPEGEDV